jgi:acyl dehydratase
MPPPPTFESLEVGRTFTGAMTVTPEHLAAGARWFGDANPVHTEPDYAERTRFEGLIAHGAMTAGIMMGVLGTQLDAGAVALVEQSLRFLEPVRPGDTLTTAWRVTERAAKPRAGGGIVSFVGEARNQRGERVAEGTCRFLIASRSGADAS